MVEGVGVILEVVGERVRNVRNCQRLQPAFANSPTLISTRGRVSRFCLLEVDKTILWEVGWPYNMTRPSRLSPSDQFSL